MDNKSISCSEISDEIKLSMLSFVIKAFFTISCFKESVFGNCLIIDLIFLLLPSIQRPFQFWNSKA